MKWKSARVGSKFKSKIRTAIRLSCSSLLAIEESHNKPDSIMGLPSFTGYRVVIKRWQTISHSETLSRPTVVERRATCQDGHGEMGYTRSSKNGRCNTETHPFWTMGENLSNEPSL